jgi:hypothetical protein
MKRTVVLLLLITAVSTNAFAILRPRFPVKPTPPFRGTVIIIENDSLQVPPQNPPPQSPK